MNSIDIGKVLVKKQQIKQEKRVIILNVQLYKYAYEKTGVPYSRR